MVNNNTHNTKTVDQSAVVQKVLDPQIQILYIKLIGSEKNWGSRFGKTKKIYIFISAYQQHWNLTKSIENHEIYSLAGRCMSTFSVVVVSHVTIVEIGHGLLKW